MALQLTHTQVARYGRGADPLPQRVNPLSWGVRPEFGIKNTTNTHDAARLRLQPQIANLRVNPL